jgi:hypothetical protein
MDILLHSEHLARGKETAKFALGMFRTWSHGRPKDGNTASPGQGGLCECVPDRLLRLVIAALVITWGLCNPTNAQLVLPGTNSARSVSGQFIVHGASPSRHSRVASDLLKNENYLELKPAFTAVSCERIKRAVADALGANSQWRAKIHLVLYTAQSANDSGTMVAEEFKDGWSYRLELPDPMERRRFVRAVVQALLVERAGRNAREHAPEIPAWLIEGLTQQLLMSNASEQLLPPPPRWAVNNLTIDPVLIGAGRHGAPRRDPLDAARRTLRERPPLTLEELSWPTGEQLDGPGGEAYRSSAQLFVVELLRLEGGRTCLISMLDELAACYNWQTAFLRAFHTHFERQIDLEKWWALQLVHFTGRNPAHTWSSGQSWLKLDEILRAPVEVRHARNELPDHAEVSLATVIRDWDFVRQTQMLRAKLQSLQLVRLRVSQDLVALVDDYRQWLLTYLERRDQAGMTLPGSKVASPGAKLVVRDALKQFSELERRRASLRPKPEAASTAKGEVDATKSP